MIYGNSGDPVLIKKISLRVWTLRDELEAVIQERASKGLEKMSIEDLLKEYKSIGSLASLGRANEAEEEVGVVKDASELDDFGEDEMAKAIAQAGAESEAAETEAETDASPQDAEQAPEGEIDQAQADLLNELGANTISETQENSNNILKLEVGLDSQAGVNLIKQRIPNIPEEKVSHAKAILAEIYMDQMFFFSNKPFLDGQSIVLDFLVPRRFVLNANVTFCRTYNLKSRIISKNRLSYRVGVKFSFLKEGERTILREFTKSIEPTFEAAKAKPAKEASQEEDSEDDIFGSLDD